MDVILSGKDPQRRQPGQPVCPEGWCDREDGRSRERAAPWQDIRESVFPSPKALSPRLPPS